MGYGNTEVFLSAEQREALIREFLGKTVTVLIDRPIGFHHVTKGIHLDYTVNYGYLPSVTGGDGEEQDVYVLGVSEPLETFTGRIIAVVRRGDDNEDKFVAAPDGMVFTRQEIEGQLHFVEKYFDSTLETIFDRRKIFLLSFDDGTVWDRRFVKLLNRYGIRGTFNLNSGLEDFVWTFEDRFPVRRQILSEIGDLYDGHEIASHSLHHHRLDQLSPPQLRREVEEDVARLKEVFALAEIGFGVPFTFCNDREVRIIKKLVRYIRLSEFADSFALPEDEYHIPIHGLYNDPDIREKLAKFAQSDLPVSLFVMAGHSYELEALDHWQYMEELLKLVKDYGFETMTTMEFVNQYYRR